MYNFLSKELEKPVSKNVLIDNYYIILKLLNLFIPHFASECLDKFSKFKKNNNEWPKTDEKLLAEEKVKIVVQINGKKREILEIEKDISENEVLDMINSSDKLKIYLYKKKLIKKIFVQNKIINLIVK